MHIAPENAINISNAIERLYGVDAETFVQNIFARIGKAFDLYPDSNITGKGLEKAARTLIFGRDDAFEPENFTASSKRDHSANEWAAVKLLKLVFGQERPREFENKINKIVTNYCENRAEFNLAEYLERHRELSPEEVEELKITASTIDNSNQTEMSVTIPETIKPDTIEAQVFQALADIAEEDGLPTEAGDVDKRHVKNIGVQYELVDEVAGRTSLSGRQVTAALHRLDEKGVIGRKRKTWKHGRTYRIDWLARSERSRTSSQTEDSVSIKKEESQKAPPIPKKEKVTRLLQVFRALLDDKGDPDLLLHSFDGVETFWLHVGQQNELQDTIEELAGFTSSQRIAAINAAADHGLIFIDGDRKSGRADYYLRADAVSTETSTKDTGTDEETESLQSSIAALKDKLAAISETKLPTLSDPEPWENLLARTRELGEEVKDCKDDVDKRITQLESLAAELDNLQSDLGNFFQVFDKGRRAAK